MEASNGALLASKGVFQASKLRLGRTNPATAAALDGTRLWPRRRRATPNRARINLRIIPLTQSSQRRILCESGYDPDGAEVCVAQGGSAHDRAVRKSAQNRLAKEVTEMVVERLSQPAPSVTSTSRLSTQSVVAIFSFIVALVMSWMGIEEVFPLPFSILVYFIALAAFLFSGWRWETVLKWSKALKVGVSLAIVIGYCTVLAYPVLRQYQHEVNIKLTFKQSPQLSWC